MTMNFREQDSIRASLLDLLSDLHQEVLEEGEVNLSLLHSLYNRHFYFLDPLSEETFRELLRIPDTDLRTEQTSGENPRRSDTGSLDHTSSYSAQ